MRVNDRGWAWVRAAGVGATIALVATLWAGRTSAQPAPEDAERTAAARALFTQGMAAVDAGDWSGAADRLRRSLALRASAVVRFNLALALIELGRFVEASEHLRSVQREAPESSELRQLAAERLEQVLPRLGRLRIELRGPRDDVEVHLDGVRVPDALVGAEQPADPGPRRVSAHRLQRGAQVELAAREVTVESGRAASVELDVPPPPPTPEELAARRELSPAEDEGIERQWWLWTLVGVLAAGAAVGIAVFLTAGTSQPSLLDPPPYIEGDSGAIYGTLLEFP